MTSQGGSGARISRSEVEEALADVQSDVVAAVEDRRRSVVLVGVAGALLVIVVAYLFGRRAGRRVGGILEIRR
jgi:hypothetical protein